MELSEASNRTFTLEVDIDTTTMFNPELARKKAKEKISEEHVIQTDFLTATVIDGGGYDVKPLVAVTLTPNRK